MKIDLLAVSGYKSGHPFDQFAWLRENAPVYKHHDPFGDDGFWAVTRYDDVRHVLMKSDLFGNYPSILLPDNISLGDETHRELLFKDGEDHRCHRRFLNPEFSPSAVKKLTDHVDAVVNEIIDDVIETGSCDIVEDLAGKMASYVIADVLGLPREDLVDMYAAADRVLNARDRHSGDGAQAAAQMIAYITRIWEHRGERKDDLIRRISHGEFGDRPVDFLQFCLDARQLIIAGGDTTRNAFSGGMAELLANPELWQLLQNKPDAIRSTVEEILRWVSPVSMQRRTALEDTELAGVAIAKGDKVVVFNPSANRDPGIFADPDRFDPLRSPNPHLAFGAGPHMCLGMNLARLELAAMLRAVVARLPDIELAGEVRWVNDYSSEPPIVVGPKVLPAAFCPGRKLVGAA